MPESACVPPLECGIHVEVPSRSLAASLFLLVALVPPNPAQDLAGLGWFPAKEAVLHGQIGALGGAPWPANLDQLKSYEALAALRAGGAATVATSNHAGLPFDLGAARLVDALVVTDGGDSALALWSLLLDHGYAVAPVAGSNARLYVPCPNPPGDDCLADAVRHQRTVVSTGPLLTAKRKGNEIEVSAWGDRLLRLELWAHNRVIATREIAAAEVKQVQATFTWTPKGPTDWVAVRVIAENGWALSSAFFAEPVKTLPPLLKSINCL